MNPADVAQSALPLTSAMQSGSQHIGARRVPLGILHPESSPELLMHIPGLTAPALGQGPR